MPYFAVTKNLGQLIRNSCKHWDSKIAVMTPVKGNFESISYRDYWTKVSSFVAALQSLGVKRGDKINIFCENSLEWSITDWAAQCLGVITVPIYPTLPSDQAQYIVKDSGASLIVCGSDELIKKVESTGIKTVRLKGVEGSLAQVAESATISEELLNTEIEIATPNDLATIIYTSGTTGVPKGVMLSHDNFLAVVQAVQATIPLDHNDVFLSFLPLSHVYERLTGHFLPFGLGATVASAQNLASIAGDMLKVRPTVMCCVPRFLDAMRSKILDSVKKAPPIRQKLFYAALAQGTAKFVGKSAPLSPLFDKIVGEKIREKMGGRFRFFVSGGAALPSHVAEFFGAFNLLVLQGFGLTETSGGTSFNLPTRNNYRTLGEIIQGIEWKIEPDGEICIRGRTVMMGYHNLPDDTAAVIDKDGWFHTGDIGQFEGLSIRITDRKKDLLVLGNGKNIAPQPIENMLKESEFISEVCLIGDGMDCVCGLIIPDFDHLKTFAAKQGIIITKEEDLIKAEPVKALIKAEIDKVNKNLADFEKVKRHVIIHARFSVETGELTPSMKVKRRVVKERFASEIQSMVKS